MRAIAKNGLNHRFLEKAHEQPPTNKDEATRSWKNLQEKNSLQQLLLDQQYQL